MTIGFVGTDRVLAHWDDDLPVASPAEFR